MNTEIQTIVIMAVNLIVGAILWQQIRSQKTIIDKYKGLVEATSPGKIIELHNREVEKIKQTMSMDIDELQKQVYELANFTAHSIEKFESWERDSPTGYRTPMWVADNMPNCKQVLDKMLKVRKQR